MRLILTTLLLLILVTGCDELKSYLGDDKEAIPSGDNTTQAVPVNLTNSTEVENITIVTILEEDIFLPPRKSNLSIYVLDVDGQSVIFLKDEYSLLLDAGFESYAEVILKRLRNIGIMNLDFAIVSNTNEGVLGGMPYIIIQTSPATIYETGVPSTSSNYLIMKELINESINKSTIVSTDKLFMFDDTFVKLMVIYDDGGGFSYNRDDNSIITRLSYKENSFLFMSNCGFNCLERLSKEDINSDALVIDGSCDSTTLTFLQRVTPEVAIATGDICDETKNRFKFLNIPLYTSKEHGDIKLESDGKNFNLKYLKSRVE